ncbi:MAG: hypothetical protein AAF670_04885 [Planctomycetota bacterium]
MNCQFAHRRRVFCVLNAVMATALISIPAGSTAQGGGVETVVPAGLFAAMDEGNVEARFIPQNATKANLLLKNLTDKPLHVRLPDAFAGVPVNGQFGGGMGGGGMGGGMGGMGGGMGGGGGGQAMGGGGMGGGMGGGGMGGGGMGGGMFRIAPGRVQKVALNTVCLEHGKPDPNPKMEYMIVPLSRVTTNPAVTVLCEALGSHQIAQNTAQAAAWHLMDGKTWQELAMMNRSESRYTGNVRWFSPLELQAARTIVAEAIRIGDDREIQSESPDHQPERRIELTDTELGSAS